MAKDNIILRDPTANDKVLWVKFGWSEYYRGGPVDGNFGWLKSVNRRKDEVRGHEAFNFTPGNDGTYYCYVPPQSSDHAPSNDDNTGWTVICLAKNPRHKGIHIVGWYENARLFGDWQALPSDHPAARLSKGSTAYDWSYCVSSKSAFFVPPEARTSPFSHPSIRQGKYSFLKGPEVQDSQNKREVLDILQSQLKDVVKYAIKNPDHDNNSDPELDPADPLSGFGTPEHRKKVEKAAEAAVIAYYEKRGYQYFDCTNLNCGYDHRFVKGSDIIDVEVKGTSSKNMKFFLTRNEYDTGMMGNPNWRIAMVTDAIGQNPIVNIFDAKQVSKMFDLVPYVYLCREIFAAE